MCKQKICDMCLTMEKPELIDVLCFLKTQGIDDHLFNQNCDGIKVNLDRIQDNIIYTLYNFILYRSTADPTN